MKLNLFNRPLHRRERFGGRLQQDVQPRAGGQAERAAHHQGGGRQGIRGRRRLQERIREHLPDVIKRLN